MPYSNKRSYELDFGEEDSLIHITIEEGNYLEPLFGLVVVPTAYYALIINHSGQEVGFTKHNRNINIIGTLGEKVRKLLNGNLNNTPLYRNKADYNLLLECLSQVELKV